MFECDLTMRLQSLDIVVSALDIHSVTICIFFSLRLIRILNIVPNKKKTHFSLTLNSCSKKLNLRNSHDSSNAVKIGSFDERAIRLGLANALYAFILDRECRSESSNRDITHSSQPHLKHFMNKIVCQIRIENSTFFLHSIYRNSLSMNEYNQLNKHLYSIINCSQCNKNFAFNKISEVILYWLLLNKMRHNEFV